MYFQCILVPSIPALSNNKYLKKVEEIKKYSSDFQILAQGNSEIQFLFRIDNDNNEAKKHLNEAVENLMNDNSTIDIEIEELNKEEVDALTNSSIYAQFTTLGILPLGFSGNSDSKDWEINVPRTNQNLVDFQWNHSVVEFPKAIQHATEEDPSRGYIGLDKDKGHEATDIHVYQLDTGWSDHPKLVQNKGYLTALSKNFIERNLSLNDSKDDLKSYFYLSAQDSGHGTSTAHTFIGTLPKDNTTSDIKSIERSKRIYIDDLNGGLFPFVNFIPLRVARRVVLNFNLFENSPKDLFEAVKYACKKKAHIITMSMGGEINDKYYKRAAEYAYKRGVIFICAAGNARIVDKLFKVVKPAEYKETIAVGGIEPRFHENERRGKVWRYYPWPKGCDGVEVDISAPARFVYTAYKRKKKNPTNVFKFGGGTSQATVHVAAAAALWRFFFKKELDEKWYKDDPTRIVEAFRWGLYQSKNCPSYWKQEYKDNNKGILNVYKLIQPNCSPVEYQKTQTVPV